MNRLLIAALTSLILSACASSALPTRPNEKEWLRLSADHEWLETLRKSAPPVSPGAPRKAQIESLLATHKKLEPVNVPFLEKLREYYERTEDPRAARLYSSEKVRVGDEYMNVLARYDRAIGMYQNALAIDPSNPEAQTKLADAQSRRYVNMKGFSSVKTGMKEDEVRGIIGMPREDWIKQVVQNKRVFSVWIYPKQDGGASAIYFDAGAVYHTNWNASPARSESK